MYTAEEKAALALFNKQEAERKEAALIANMQARLTVISNLLRTRAATRMHARLTLAASSNSAAYMRCTSHCCYRHTLQSACIARLTDISNLLRTRAATRMQALVHVSLLLATYYARGMQALVHKAVADVDAPPRGEGA